MTEQQHNRPSTSAEGPRLRVAVSALSDVGLVRANNKDCFGYNEALGIYVLCDGMGGMASGEVASSRAVSAILHSYAETSDSAASVGDRLLHALQDANLDVWSHGQSDAHRGMGTTAVVAAIDGDKLILGNVGDSRAYLYKDGICTQLTVDHSYINELIRNGELTLENAHHADLQGMESAITRAVGSNADVEPDFFSIELQSGNALLLATDGLTRYLDDQEICAVLATMTIDSACARLIALANQRGGQDNTTCVLLQAFAAPHLSEESLS
jgi:protein phosphatase